MPGETPTEGFLPQELRGWAVRTPRWLGVPVSPAASGEGRCRRPARARSAETGLSCFLNPGLVSFLPLSWLFPYCDISWAKQKLKCSFAAA